MDDHSARGLPAVCKHAKDNVQPLAMSMRAVSGLLRNQHAVYTFHVLGVLFYRGGFELFRRRDAATFVG